MTIVLYLLSGLLAGFMAGLFGVGGGAIIVPILIYMFASQGFASEVLIHTAIGTSFAIVVVTSMGSVRAHQQLGNVRWWIFRRMLPGLIVGVVCGGWLAAGVSSTHLQMAIGVFFMAISLQMFFGYQPKAMLDIPGPAGLASAGLAIGGVSAFFGIGGGSMTVPFLSSCREPMKQAVATSAACGLPIALVGAITYAYVGAGKPYLPNLSSGFIYWPAFIGVGFASILSTRYGALCASKLPERRMKQCFALLLFLVAGQLLFGA